MFSDLKGLTNNEESYKIELIENRNKKHELEILVTDLEEKTNI